MLSITENLTAIRALFPDATWDTDNDGQVIIETGTLSNGSPFRLIPETTTVYVQRHENAEVGYVINDRDDQESTFRDYLNNDQESVEIAGHIMLPADILFGMDRMAYSEEFLAFCEDWTVMQMPTDVWLGNRRENAVEWVEANIGKL